MLTTPMNDPALSRAAEVVQPLLESRFESTYAGLEIRNEVPMVVVYRKPDPELDAAVRKAAPDVRIEFRDVRYTRAEMAEHVQRVMDDTEYWQGRGVKIVSAGPDVDGSGVEVGSANAPGDLVRQLEERYPAMSFNVEQSGEIVPAPYTGPQPVFPTPQSLSSKPDGESGQVDHGLVGQGGLRRQPVPARSAGSPADRLCPGRRQHPRSPHSCGEVPAKTLIARIPKRARQRMSAGAGAKGQRYYDWAHVDIHGRAGHRGNWWLLVRRNWRTGELAFYHCFSPRPVPLSELVRVAGRRWTIEETFQADKGLTGLDEHQVTRWTSWHRWVTLAMLAHASSPSPRPLNAKTAPRQPA